MKISIAIPTYEMGGVGATYLKESLDIISRQTFKDFEVVVSDDSENSDVMNVCSQYPFVKYFHNPVRLGLTANTNQAIKKCSGELIKILFQDDFLYHDNALKDIVDNFHGNWLVTACEHFNGEVYYRPFLPYYNDNIHLGLNTISSPSVLTILNKEPMLFDETLTWLMDCDYYKRCYQKHGLPTILNTINVVNRTHDKQTTSLLEEEVKRAEVNLMKQKYV